MSIAVRWIMLPLFAWSAAAQQDVARQIEQLSTPGRAEALGAKLLKDSRAPAAAAAEVWRSSDSAVRQNARIVLNEMEETALDPLLKANGKLDPAEQVWRMTMVVETIGELRKSAAAMLDRQLTDKQAAPPPTMPGAEQREPVRRVCDAAYLQMNRLLAIDPESEAFVQRMRQFMRMPDSARDTEIQRARQAAAWRSLLR